jgi:GT2 family glycosyltransferase
MTGTVPVSVVVPTVGRPRLLADCLGSISRCDPLPSEVLLVDQSGEPAVADVAERFGARLVVLPQPNVARARNVGLREAREAVMLCTDDDCTVERSWVGTGHQLLQRDPDRIVTGRVLFGGGDPPSLREGETRQEHTGERRGDVLFTNNMAARPRDVLEFGGFDERFAAAAEDNDLCYRWLRAGRRLWFEPSLVITHHGWRGPEELTETYGGYWRGQGTFYGKHLRRGDARMLRFLAADLSAAVRAGAGSMLHRRPAANTTPRPRLIAAGLVRGLLRR